MKIITNTDPSKGQVVLNCNPNLIHYCIPVHSLEWYDFRTTGIEGVYDSGFGASEVPKLLQVEPQDYSPVLPQMLEQKAGIALRKDEINEAMLSGILAEDSILERWRYYDGSQLGYLLNYQSRQPKREFEKVNAYIVNKRFPWLFVSLDAVMLPGYAQLDGMVLDKKSPLELKTISFQSAKAQPNRVPLSYVYQIQTQMLVTETSYAEMAILEGGSKFRVYHFEFVPEIGQKILEVSFEHYQTVQRLKQMNAKKNAFLASGHYLEADELTAEMNSLLPLPGQGEGYSDYYSDKYDSQQISSPATKSMRGSMAQFKLIRRRSELQAYAKLLERETEEITNLFRHDFSTKNVEEFDFDTLGRVKMVKRANTGWYPDFKGIKEKVDIGKIEERYQLIKSIIDQK